MDKPQDEPEIVEGPDFNRMSVPQKQALWETKILDRASGKCGNCGSTHRVKVKMIVPLEAGGQFTLENGTTICRSCEIATDVVGQSTPGRAERPVNFWVSRRLFDKTKAMNGFSSKGALVRFLMNKFVSVPDRFDDLHMWQEDGTDVKINVWVDRKIYDTFKDLVNARGLTVTDALKALLRMYEEEAEPLVRRKHGKTA
jgi:hypothetical protein